MMDEEKFFLSSAAAIIALAVLLFTSGCSLPVGTRKITAWGVGCIPMSGYCVPFAGYWYSEHGGDTGNYKRAPPPIIELHFDPPAAEKDTGSIPTWMEFNI